jgi:dihydropteroate synthase
MTSPPLKWGRYQLDWRRRTLIMGVLNVTPDSFSDGGQFFDPDAAVVQAEKMVAEGADIIDIGGESTRPFSDPVPEKEELERVIPVIEAITATVNIPVSIDTQKAAVANAALDAGASIINDISALSNDSAMGQLAAKRGVPLILMHMQGDPKTMQEAPLYDDLMGEVIAFLQRAAKSAQDAGVKRSHIILDPGIGFGKTFAHNFEILSRLDELKAIGLPLLVGASRKAFIRHTVKAANKKDIAPQHPDVIAGSLSAAVVAALNGAAIIRVHDVALTRASLKVADAILGVNG